MLKARPRVSSRTVNSSITTAVEGLVAVTGAGPGATIDKVRELMPGGIGRVPAPSVKFRV